MLFVFKHYHARFDDCQTSSVLRSKHMKIIKAGNSLELILKLQKSINLPLAYDDDILDFLDDSLGAIEAKITPKKLTITQSQRNDSFNITVKRNLTFKFF